MALETRTPTRYFCGHCNRQLSKTLFFRHKRMFFDRKARKWSSVKVISDDTTSEPFTLTSSDDDSSDEEDFKSGLTDEGQFEGNE